MTALAKKPKELQSLKSISEEYHLPYKFIGQVAAALLDQNLIVSKEGATGGYKLAKPAKQITLNQVMEALDGPVVKVDCLCGKPCPRKDRCRHKQVLGALSAALNQALCDKTIADLLN